MWTQYSIDLYFVFYAGGRMMKMNGSSRKKSIRWDWFPVLFVTAFFCCFLWGSAAPVIKVAYELFRIDAADTASRITLAGARFMIAGGMVILFGSAIAHTFLRPQAGSVGNILILAVIQTIGQYFFFFMALANISGVRGTIINASGNFFAILLAIIMFRLERMTMRKLAGCLIGFAGILMILGGVQALSDGGSFTLKGEGAMLLAALFYAASGCLIKIYSRSENPVVLSGYQFLIGGAVLFGIGILMGGRLNFYTPACAGTLIYLGFVSAGAYTLWGILLKNNPVSRVSILGFMNPVMGVLISAVLLHEGNEAFSWKGLAALALVSVGIIIVNSEHADAGTAGK